MRKTTTKAPTIQLPAGINASDLEYPKNYKDRARDAAGNHLIFELWNVTSLGWCIPTLLIRHPGRRSTQTTARTYATTLDGKSVRIGMGPHVTTRVTVHVTKKRETALRKFTDLQLAGAIEASTIRDRISSRRAATEVRRMNRGW